MRLYPPLQLIKIIKRNAQRFCASLSLLPLVTFFTTQLKVKALAAMAALSVSAFHRHFKAVTALSPLQYQKRVRLLHARNMLIAGEGNTTSVAFGIGYESLTPFSRDYSLFFGLPSFKDARQIVRALQPAVS
jgi:AraC-like DNA-binding protein